MLLNVLSVLLGAGAWYLSMRRTDRQLQYLEEEVYANIINITSCAREDYNEIERYCRRAPTLEFLGMDKRNYHDEWEWSRIYTVHWTDADPDYPIHLLWNISDFTVAKLGTLVFPAVTVTVDVASWCDSANTNPPVLELDLSRVKQRLDFSPEDLAVAFSNSQPDKTESMVRIRRAAGDDEYPDNRLVVTQAGLLGVDFTGPRFVLVKKRAKLVWKVNNGVHNFGSVDDDNTGENWGSKIVSQRYWQMPDRIETGATVATIIHRQQQHMHEPSEAPRL